MTIPAGSTRYVVAGGGKVEVVERLRHDLETRHFQLLEKLAEHVAGVVLEDFGAAWVRVSVAKIGVLRGVKRVGVTIERSRAA